jgi:hypothetical protein
MLTASCLLAVIGLLGAFDIVHFHWRTCRLAERRESRLEVAIHVARGFLYAAQFAVVPNLRFHGAWYAAFAALFAADVAIAIADVAVEPASRKSQGGLPGGEYLMHVVLSVLVGAYLHSIAADSLAWARLPTEIVWAPAAPLGLRIALGAMGAGSALVALYEGLDLIERALPRPGPLHVAVRLRASLEAVWDLTQDHRVHPAWDHRFSRIEMLDDTIRAGTEMRYERAVLGMTIRGFGRYKLLRRHTQSTFEFWSDDPRSLIRRGVGLWLYRRLEGGLVEFRTSYTYTVRWGLIGRLIDRLVFRRFFQRETERSFRRLAERYFPEGASPVLGADGRKPARFRASQGPLRLIEAV